MPTRALMRPQATTEAGAAPRGFSSRHYLKLIEDTGKVGFWSADLRSERLDASPGLYRILGLDPTTEMTFGFGLDMIHPEDQAAHGDQIAVLRSGQPVSREFRIIRPDRTQRWLLHHAEVMLGADGRPSQGMGVVFDVTAQHETMNALMQRHDRLNALIAATAAVFWVNKANGEPSEMPQWMALTGQSHAQMQGLGWLDAVHPDDRSRTLAAWTTAVEHTAPYNTDYRVLCADGIYRWFTPAARRSSTRTALSANGSRLPQRSGTYPLRGVTARGCTAAENRVDRARRRDPDPEPNPRARAITGLSKDDLAALANVSVSTLNRLEDPASAVRSRSDTLLAVRRALEEAGVAFIFEAGKKPGVREA